MTLALSVLLKYSHPRYYWHRHNFGRSQLFSVRLCRRDGNPGHNAISSNNGFLAVVGLHELLISQTEGIKYTVAPLTRSSCFVRPCCTLHDFHERITQCQFLSRAPEWRARSAWIATNCCAQLNILLSILLGGMLLDGIRRRASSIFRGPFSGALEQTAPRPTKERIQSRSLADPATSGNPRCDPCKGRAVSATVEWWIVARTAMARVCSSAIDCP